MRALLAMTAALFLLACAPEEHRFDFEVRASGPSCLAQIAYTTPDGEARIVRASIPEIEPGLPWTLTAETDDVGLVGIAVLGGCGTFEVDGVDYLTVTPEEFGDLLTVDEHRLTVTAYEDGLVTAEFDLPRAPDEPLRFFGTWFRSL